LTVNGGAESSQDFLKNILICVSKMNKSLTGLKRHKGENFMTEFSLLGELSL